jgi:hypothetical protein
MFYIQLSFSALLCGIQVCGIDAQCMTLTELTFCGIVGYLPGEETQAEDYCNIHCNYDCK